MDKYVLKIKPKSSIKSVISNDLFFGHICWAIKFFEGEKALKIFIEEVVSNKKYFFISNLLPENKLPKPLVNIDYDSFKYKDLKKIKKIKFVDKNIFKESISIEESLLNYFKKVLPLKDFKYEEKVNRKGVSINRINNSALDGILFNYDETFYNDSCIFDIYIFSNYEYENIKNRIINTLAIGIGADRSIGKGFFDFISLEKVSLPNDSGGYYMSLGNFVPKQMSDIKSYRTSMFTKYGKVGNNYNKVPFKKPIVMFSEGSVFKMNNNSDYVGSILKNIHVDTDIIHYAYSPTISINMGDLYD